MHRRGGEISPTFTAPGLCPATAPLRPVPASMTFVSDSNHLQPLRKPPPTACLTASGAASEVRSLTTLPHELEPEAWWVCGACLGISKHRRLCGVLLIRGMVELLVQMSSDPCQTRCCIAWFQTS